MTNEQPRLCKTKLLKQGPTGTKILLFLVSRIQWPPWLGGVTGYFTEKLSPSVKRFMEGGLAVLETSVKSGTLRSPEFLITHGAPFILMLNVQRSRKEVSADAEI